MTGTLMAQVPFKIFSLQSSAHISVCLWKFFSKYRSPSKGSWAKEV